MQTIRGRLVVWYTTAMSATLLVFALTVFLLQRSEQYGELDRRVRLDSDLITALLRESALGRDSLVVVDPETGNPLLIPEVAALFEGVPGYVVVLGVGGRLLYASPSVRALPRQAYEAFVGEVGARAATPGLRTFSVPGGETNVRYSVRPMREAGDRITAVVAGSVTVDVDLGPQQLLSVMLLVAPGLLVLSAIVSYVLVGRTLKPVDVIVDEVEAITDGRSLHRRLMELRSQDELARLTTTLNQMLARLERSFGVLRRFTADASHELRTPLTVLRAGIERSITHPRTPAEVMAILEETLVEVKRMSDIVESLLTLARADEGRAPLHLEEIDFREVIGEVAETAGILGEEAQVHVEVEIPEQPIAMSADRDRIRQLLMNLLTNAIKYTPAGGSVRIGSVREDGQLVVNVRDTGVGIAPGDLGNVFVRFWRADRARSRAGVRPGTGLGLAICKWIAEAHGGSIAVQSRPGRGTIFTVTLPVVPPSPPDEEAPVEGDEPKSKQPETF